MSIKNIASDSKTISRGGASMGGASGGSGSGAASATPQVNFQASRKKTKSVTQ
jgi:hypothetical protein